MKSKLVIIFVVICCVLSACSRSVPNDGNTETYIIPCSYFEFTGSEISDAVASCLSLGDAFCTEAKEVPEGMQLKLTDKQLENLIQRNNEFIKDLADKLEDSNSLYKFVMDDSYKNLTLYFDENIPSTLQVQTILGIASYYGMNYMLLNNTVEWNVQIEIFNCHTNKLVASVNIPDEEISYGAKDWEESYNVGGN